MTAFAPILEAALARTGGEGALATRLPEAKPAAELLAMSDDRYLSLMSLRVFRAGIKHSVVDARWPAFEDAFHGFDPGRVRPMSDEDLEALMGNTRLIRHWSKIKSVRANAAAISAVSEESGGFGAYLADWPSEIVVGLWDDLAKRFSNLGGASGPYFLRMAGKDTFILTPSVVKALIHWGAVDGEPKGKRARAQVQETFNAWAEETGRPLCQLSMILAQSVD